MDREEFERIYGHVKVRFSSYYKYTFYFNGMDGFNHVSVECGGDSSDIYRFDVDADKDYTVSSLPIVAGRVSTVNDTTLASFSDV